MDTKTDPNESLTYQPYRLVVHVDIFLSQGHLFDLEGHTCKTQLPGYVHPSELHVHSYYFHGPHTSESKQRTHMLITFQMRNISKYSQLANLPAFNCLNKVAKFFKRRFMAPYAQPIHIRHVSWFRGPWKKHGVKKKVTLIVHVFTALSVSDVRLFISAY